MSAIQSHSDHHRDIDELDSAIVLLAAHINATSFELLVPVRRFDKRAGWLKWGFSNCAEWLHWRCDLSLSAASRSGRQADIGPMRDDQATISQPTPLIIWAFGG